MAFEKITAEINILLSKLVEAPQDRETLEVTLREKLNEMRAFGMPLPADLVALEAALDQELTAEEIERVRLRTLE